jgi:restriction system protein
VQQFAGALHGRKASKGVFITTSTFSREAVEYARGVQTAIVLIDGKELGELMLDYGIGVSLQETIRLQRVDEDYFVEE